MKSLKLDSTLILYAIIGTLWFAFVIYEILTGNTFGLAK